MTQNLGTFIPWPDRAQFTQSPLLAEELERITSERVVMNDPRLASRMGLMATANGLETFEARDFTHNATTVVLQQLAEASLSRVKPEILLPTMSAALDSVNLFANQHPIELLSVERLNGGKHVPSIVYAKSNYLNVRNQDFSVIEDEPEYMQSLGLGGQAFQPFAWLFVERESSMDVLHRFRNPFETTLFLAIDKSLKSALPGGDSSKGQSFLSRFGFGGKR
jgi:hypothetical protein